MRARRDGEVEGDTAVKRFPAFDPPEYLNWQPDPGLVQEFTDVWRRDAARRPIIEALTHSHLFDLYAGLVRTRLHDVALKRWVRQGVISKAWLGTGEEAATVGPVHALDRATDIVAPMIRNAGACCEMGMPVADMLRGYLGTYDSPSRGRDGHVGSFAHGVLPPISNIGNMPAVTGGIALSFVLRGERRVALTWVGDGSVKSGPTHEAFNFAAVQKLPVVFIIQNNQVALGTEVKHAHLPGRFHEVAESYGIAGWSFDGNNVLDAFAAARLAAERCRRGEGPVILDAETFRMGGHATHDEQEARHVLPAALFEYWGRRDPVGLFEEHLKGRGVTPATLQQIEDRVTSEVERAADEALASRETNQPPPASAVQGVYAQEAS
ncbi:MAG: thiamine pyrophosphate-dependent dehydrogenase E1 component subunit alpha [Gemmatimonadetes bacterium]|nr:thiamine pyrophosphate-dependent dehydrogenase E1 component subunit alpha [Gemmatimonadota bacterium]